MSQPAVGPEGAEARANPLFRALIALAALALCLPVFYVWRSYLARLARTEAEASHQTLAGLFADQSVPPLRQADLENLFVAMMYSPQGRSDLASLARDNRWIAYHEGRHTVFYGYRNPSGSEGGRQQYQSAVGRVTIDPAKASDWRDQRGCVLSGYMTLSKVTLDRDKVWIDFETSSDARWKMYLDEAKLDPAAKYRVIYDAGPVLLEPKQFIKDARRQ